MGGGVSSPVHLGSRGQDSEEVLAFGSQSGSPETERLPGGGRATVGRSPVLRPLRRPDVKPCEPLSLSLGVLQWWQEVVDLLV